MGSLLEPSMKGACSSLMEAHIKDDNRQRKQSSLEKTFKKRTKSWNPCGTSLWRKLALAAAKKKEKDDEAKGEELRAAALQTLK